MAQALSHITFIVSNLDAMEQILVEVFDARRVYDSGEATYSLSPERFYLVGHGPDAVWIASMQGEPLGERTYNHVAFRILEAEYDELLRRIHALGLDLRESRPRVDGEGRSIYFHDRDNHLFELHTGSLEQRLKRYRHG